MKIQQTALLNIMVLFLGFGIVGETLGQADPMWLEDWNEALESRPEVLASTGRIAPKDEPGTPLVIHGQIFEPDGSTPAAGVIVHAYHRDQAGFDFGPDDRAFTTWRLQGWVVSDSEGRFEFQTIMPAADHLGREGPHLHFTVESARFGRQWPPVVYFMNDPLLPESQKARSKAAGKFGWVRETVTVDEVQHLDVKFRLKEQADF